MSTIQPICSGRGSHGRISFAPLTVEGANITERLVRSARSPWNAGTVIRADGETQDAPTRMIVSADSARWGDDAWRWKCPRCKKDARVTTSNLLAWIKAQGSRESYSLDLALLPR